MMEDVRAGNVDCIVVKDLSRFGRDYIEAGRLIQKTFPALKVRFIAVTDGFDSLTADDNETSFVLPIKNFVNDAYCRDISCKVKSHQRMKREKGEFIGAFAVYGYRKDENDKNRLVPDRYAAHIVKTIFKWKMQGMSSLAIANRLNDTGILSPMEYKKSNGEKFSSGFACQSGGWSSVAVKRILTNEIYTGTMVQGKSEKVNYKLKTCREKPQDEWVRVADTHEAIVTKDDFDMVQKLLQTGSRALSGNHAVHLFAGLLFCGDCGEPMVRRVSRYKGTMHVHFICRTRNRGEGCTRHSISEEELKEVLLQGVQKQAALLSDEMKVAAHAQKLEVGFETLAQLEQEVLRLRGEQENYLFLRSCLYEDYKGGLITGEDYESFGAIYEARYAKLQSAIEKQEKLIHTMFKSGIAGGIRLDRFKETAQIAELSRDVLLSFVDKILVYEEKRICISLRGKEPFSGLNAHCESGGAVSAEATRHCRK